MESLRLALSTFPARVASAAPSRIDRQLREIAAALAALLSPDQETDAEEDAAVHLLLDAFCRAHAEDHMSDHTKLGSWRLPFVAVLHSHDSLHLPLIKQLEALLQRSNDSLGPVQCSALTTFMLFMSPCQILPSKNADDSSKDDMNVDDRIVENCNGVKALFTWSWETCFRAQSVEEQDEGGASERSRFCGDHWMDQFCDAFLMDCEANILWFTRFAASYLRNVAVYWEHVLFRSRAWLLSDPPLKSVTLVGPIFVAFVPQTMVTFLLWLQQRLDFAHQFTQEETSPLRKALALCETVLASPLGVLLLSTNVSVSMSRFFELELRAGWKEFALSKSRHLFLRSVVWGSSSFTHHFSWGLLWKDYSGDKTRACIALAAVFLTSQCKENVVEEQLSDDVPENSWSGTKKQCVRAETPDLPLLLWLKASEASPAEVDILQIITELSIKMDPQCGPWFLEAAFDCLNNQAGLENAIFTHCESCAHAHKCKSRLWNSGICNANRLKSCITAVPPSHAISYERLYKMEKVFMFCWLGDGPFSVDFASQLLSYFLTSQTTGLFLKAENRWSTLLLASWVRYFNVIKAPLLSIHRTVGGINLGSILSDLHTTQEFLTSTSVNDTLDIDAFKAAATAMPELAAVTLIESLFTCTNVKSSREGFLANLATTKASPQLQEISRRAEELFTGLHDARSFLKSLLFNLVYLSSMAVIASPEIILKKWNAFEYKRRWVKSPEERSKPSTLSLAAIELEFDERIGKPQRSIWDILLEWVISLIALDPCLLKDVCDDGPRALTLVVVVAGLPREIVFSLAGKSASWTVLLSQMRVGLELGFRRLFLGDLSALKAEMELYLLHLEELNKVIVL